MAGTICTERIIKDVDYRSVDCGNESINRKLKDVYYADLLRQGYTYKILALGKTLGYYMITFKKINIKDWTSDEITGYVSNLSDDFFSIHIQFIMIDKKFQKHGIGTVVLKSVMKEAKELSKIWPIRFLTLDALRDKFDWYRNIGFLPINEREVENDSFYIKMYYDCMENKNTLDEYVKSCEE